MSVCKFCGAPPYKDSVACETEEEAKACQEIDKKFKEIWASGKTIEEWKKETK